GGETSPDRSRGRGSPPPDHVSRRRDARSGEGAEIRVRGPVAGRDRRAEAGAEGNRGSGTVVPGLRRSRMADEVGVDVTRRRFLRLPDRGWAMLLVLAAAAYAPASLYAPQSRLLARGYRLAFVVILVFIVLAALSAVLARVLPTRTGAAWFAVAVFWLLFSSGRGLAGSFGAAGVLGLAV